VLIAHLSDPHLTAGPLAAGPAAGLHRALGRVLALDPRPDCVVVTGDLADHGRPAEYEQLQEIIAAFPLPLHLVAGNHDASDALVAAFGGGPHLGASTYYVARYPELTIVVLDSAVPGRPEGRVGEAQLAWLDDVLAGAADRPAAVCLHHPPVAVGFPAMDAIRLTDGDALADVLAGRPHVARVLTGHLHRVATATFAGTTVSVAPSTYRQTDLRLREGPLGFADEPTGFLLHLAEPDRWVTHLVAVSHAAGASAGY
jgi:3',5'-cyclic AMP phosphodiesterase CpdA